MAKPGAVSDTAQSFSTNPEIEEHDENLSD